MILRSNLLRLLVITIFLALASMPFGGTTGLSVGAPVTDTMVGMSMEGPAAADMDCCPEEAPDPAATCDKSACPTMVTCMQQCIAGTPSTELPVLAASNRDAMGLPRPDEVLASLGLEPPPRPPRA